MTQPPSSGPDAVFDGLMGALDYPMFIVTARRADERAGCLVGFATQASIRPPRFLACLSVRNRTYRVAQDARRVAVHLVPDSAPGLAELFGGETGDDVDKFAACAWRDGPHDLPILEECENWFVGVVEDRIAFGDHVGFVLAPHDVEHGSAGGQFTFHRARRIDPGHEA